MLHFNVMLRTSSGQTHLVVGVVAEGEIFTRYQHFAPLGFFLDSSTLNNPAR